MLDDHGSPRRWSALRVSIGLLLLLAAGCTPRVDLSADKPITINLNVKIDHEIRVKVENDLDRVLSHDSGLF
jgi:YnbE-like lipoprotein